MLFLSLRKQFDQLVSMFVSTVHDTFKEVKNTDPKMPNNQTTAMSSASGHLD